MKNIWIIAVSMLVLWSCEEEETNDDFSVPAEFSVDIPDELSTVATASGSRVNDDVALSGEEIYIGLRGFIKIAEVSAEVIEDIMQVAGIIKATGASEFESISDDDGRLKRYYFYNDVTYDGVDYAHELLIEDVDGGKALQVVWNEGPVDGIAIMSPYNIDRTENGDDEDALFQVAYSENEDQSYQQMIVSISNVDDIGLDKLKMTVTKEGDIVDVIGNANFPDYEIPELIDAEPRNFAFRARSSDANDIAVAEVAIPLSTVSTTDMLMEDYSIYNVFEQAIMDAGLDNQDLIDLWLTNANPPAYFDVTGFIGAGGDLPDGFSEEFSDISSLTPFVPSEVAALTISFME